MKDARSDLPPDSMARTEPRTSAAPKHLNGRGSYRAAPSEGFTLSVDLPA